jgi:hypothetical protein
VNDLERFVELYRSVGIDLSPKKEDDGGFRLDLVEGEHPKFDGYSYFCSIIQFDANGVFVSQGFWE